jgi:four helix bundle protein
MGEYTSRRNINRGYMKLDVWQRSVELYAVIHKILYDEVRIDLKVRSQIDDAAQSISANIAEGYSRRSIKEYLQHLYVAAGSLSEALTRSAALRSSSQLSLDQFERIDSLHYEVENKLIRLIEALERKRDAGDWVDRISEEAEQYQP